MTPFTKILVPTDFSTGAELALELALDLRQRFGATLTLFHAYQLPMAYTEVYAFSAELTGAIERSAREQMTRTTARVEQQLRGQGAGGAHLPLEAKIVAGPPASAILDEAKSGGYDLIVMGTHGRTGLSHLFIGSVAERVVRLAACPVLTVRGDGK